MTNDLRSELVKIAFEHMLDERLHGLDAEGIATTSREYADAVMAEMEATKPGSEVAGTLREAEQDYDTLLKRLRDTPETNMPKPPPATGQAPRLTDTLAVLKKLRKRMADSLGGNESLLEDYSLDYKRGVDVGELSGMNCVNQAIREAERDDDGGK